MNIVDLLSHPAAESIIVLIAAFIGVGGSFTLYFIRERRNANFVRKAIFEEIYGNAFLDEWEVDDDPPFNSPFSNTVYTSNAVKLSYLTEPEMTWVVAFYAHSKFASAQIDHWREYFFRNLDRQGKINRPAKSEQVLQNLRGQLTQLKEIRENALLVLASNIKGESLEQFEDFET